MKPIDKSRNCQEIRKVGQNTRKNEGLVFIYSNDKINILNYNISNLCNTNKSIKTIYITDKTCVGCSCFDDDYGCDEKRLFNYPSEKEPLYVPTKKRVVKELKELKKGCTDGDISLLKKRQRMLKKKVDLRIKKSEKCDESNLSEVVYGKHEGY